jgi:hypothetical protein
MINRLSRKTLERIFILLIGIIYGVVEHFTQIPASIRDGLIITLLLFIAEGFLEREFSSSETTKKDIYDVFIRSDRQFHGKLLGDLRKELDETIKMDTDRFIVEHRHLAIASYDSFWKLLVDHREKTKNPLKVQAIHSCEIDIWVDHSLTQSLLSRQKQFCDLGGKVSRILCGKGNFSDSTMKKAAKGMLEAGIEVFYYNLHDGKVIDHNFSWDFMRVEETGHAVIWDSFANRPNGVIDEAIYCRNSEYKGQDLAILWSALRSYSKVITLDDVV